MKELRVFVADDSEVVRKQLQLALSQIEGCKLVGATGGNTEATALSDALQPDMVILDISMPHREGIRVLRDIRKVVTQADIIIFTADPSVVLQEVCLEAGANFYLDKTQIQDLIDILSEQLVQTRGTLPRNRAGLSFLQEKASATPSARVSLKGTSALRSV